MAIEGYDWLAWRTNKGWSVTHAVIGADTVTPEDCKGYYTVCMRKIPENALEVVEVGKRGVARSRIMETIHPRSKGIGTLLFGVDFELCKHCKRKIDGDR